jgi:hypothetical protein
VNIPCPAQKPPPLFASHTDEGGRDSAFSEYLCILTFIIHVLYVYMHYACSSMLACMSTHMG